MSWRNNFVYAFITYLLAFVGTGAFYYNFRTEKLIHSRLLGYFKWIYNIVIIIGLAGNFSEFLQIYQAHVESELISICIYGLDILTFIGLLSCIYCAKRWHLRFFKLLDKLLMMEKLCKKTNYISGRVKKNNLKRIYNVKCLFFGFNIIINIIRACLENASPMFQLVNVLLTVYCDAILFVHFTIIWLVCNMFFKLLFNLNQLLIDPMPIPAQYHDVLQIQRMYGRLIRMISEINQLFKYPLLNVLLYVIGHSCLCGYLFVRSCFEGFPDTSINETLIATIFAFYDILNFFLLATVAQTAENLREETFFIIRQTLENMIIVERSVSKIRYTIVFVFLCYCCNLICNTGGLACLATNMAAHEHLRYGRVHHQFKSGLFNYINNFY